MRSKVTQTTAVGIAYTRKRQNKIVAVLRILR